MQSQQQTKGEVIAELRGKTDSFSIKDIGANGIKIENNDVGQLTGKYQANFMETVSIHMKTDGTSEWDGKSIEMAGKDMVVGTSHGKGRNNADGTIWSEGGQKSMTKAPRRTWQNNTDECIE